MATCTFARAVLVGSSACLLYAGAAWAQSTTAAQTDTPLGNGLRIGAPDAFADQGALLSPGPALPGRLDWLRSGLNPERRSQSSFALPGHAALGLSVAQTARHEPGIDPLRDQRAGATAMRVEASYLLGDKWGLTSQYETGSVSDPTPSLQGLSSRRESLGVSVFRTGNLLSGDRLSLTLSSPVRTGMGALAGEGAGVSATTQSDAFMGLHAGSHEYATELSYVTPLSPYAGLGFTVSQRTNALHDYGAPDERMMSIRFSTRF